MWSEKHLGEIAPTLSPPMIVARTRRSGRWARWLCVLLSGYGAIRFCVYCIGSVSSVKHILGDQRWAYDAFTEGNHVKDPLSSGETERLFLSVPDPKSALAASREYATHPHIASSSEDYEDALVILKLFQEEFSIPAPDVRPVFPAGTAASRAATLGINKLVKPTAWVDVYYPIMNTPLDQSLQILAEDGTVAWNADLTEDGDPADPDAAKYKDSVPTFHGFSKDGDVAGKLIYANYGRPDDYGELVGKGANFTDKIVIVRYGEILRGLKIKGAEERGAVGVLIYSDPRDDGVVTVENGYIAYPLGPARNPTAVERGSVQLISQYPGDPTTPGYPAYENATREEAGNVPNIPSLPISWQNARRLLEEIAPPEESRKLTGLLSRRTIKLVNHGERNRRATGKN
ncbi:hypothetical protein EIP86_003993 [Pleurotus ostreatoroseus]|nr:hypothetical protein EIP86_003993 [Pleurotus ostreatoroseus]